MNYCLNPNPEMELCGVCEKNTDRLEGIAIKEELSFYDFKPEPATKTTDEKCVGWLYHPIYKD